MLGDHTRLSTARDVSRAGCGCFDGAVVSLPASTICFFMKGLRPKNFDFSSWSHRWPHCVGVTSQPRLQRATMMKRRIPPVPQISPSTSDL